jgi:hypothetical protein
VCISDDKVSIKLFFGTAECVIHQFFIARFAIVELFFVEHIAVACERLMKAGTLMNGVVRLSNINVYGFVEILNLINSPMVILTMLFV